MINSVQFFFISEPFLSIIAHISFPIKKSVKPFYLYSLPGCVAQSVTCLTADPGVASLNAARSFLAIDHEIISIAILLPSADSRRVVVSYKYVHKVLVYCSFKLAQAKIVVRSIDRPDRTKAVDWDVKHQTKPSTGIGLLTLLYPIV